MFFMRCYMCPSSNFLKWIADKLGIRKSRFIDTVRHWEAMQYKESIGREGISFESKQTIYNTWIENCITSMDEWSGRNIFQISKRKYLEKFGKLSHESIGTISLGKVLSLWPFFITYPTEKEIFWCLCKMCLNARLLFDPIKVQAKNDGDACPDSITEYLMSSCECPKLENGYYQSKLLQKNVRRVKVTSHCLWSVKIILHSPRLFSLNC